MDVRLGDTSKVIGKTAFGTNVFEIEVGPREERVILKMAERVMDSKVLWSKVLPSLNARDKELYKILFERSFPESATMKEVFRAGQCRRNAMYSCWLMNDRQLISTKYEISRTEKHWALINKHSQKIMDPTFEANPEATHSSNWRHSTIVSLMYECLNQENAVLGFPVNSLEEIIAMNLEPTARAFFDAAKLYRNQ